MSYISRLGMITTAVILWVIAFLYYTFLATDSLGGRKPSDSIALIFATISSLGLAIVGACNEDENSSLHGSKFFLDLVIFHSNLINDFSRCYSFLCLRNCFHVD